MKSILLTIFILTTLVDIASRSLYCRRKSRDGIKYEVHKYFNNWIDLAVFLVTSWTILAYTGDGFDSGIVWWLLCFFLGMVASQIIRCSTDFICKRKWPVLSEEMITTIKTPKSLLILGHSMLLALQLAIMLFFLYNLFISESDDTTFFIITVAMIVLFLFSSSNSAYEIWKLIRRKF